MRETYRAAGPARRRARGRACVNPARTAGPRDISVRVAGMWSSRVSIIAVLAVALSCGGSSKPTTLASSWVAPSILAQVPADSPYVFTTLQPIDEKLRSRLFRGLHHGLAGLLATSAQVKPSER